jgi:ankyrin repeat protein
LGSIVVGLCVTSTASAGDTRLIDAVKRQDKALIRTLLREKVDPNAPQPDGATALQWAANRNDLDVAGLLIKSGAKVDDANDYGVTPLSLACENGSPAMVDLLLKAGANPNLALPSGETPLMTASRTGSLPAVTLLLDSGANVNAVEPVAGQSALLWALSEQHYPIVQALVGHGADVTLKSKSGFTPLMMAARFNSLEATTLLLAKGASVNDVADDGVSVLMVAVLRGHSPLAMYLLDHGADPNVDKAGYTALHWAVGRWESSMTHDYPDTTEAEWRYLGGVPTEKVALVKALIAHGADVNARLTKNPPRYGIDLFHMMPLPGATPFFLAALSAEAEVMRVLAANGADPRITNNDGTTPLMVAAGLGRTPGDSLITDEDSIEPVKVCLQLGIDINAANSSGETALHGTAYYGNPKVAQLLVDSGANMSLKNKRGDTPLKVSEGYSQNTMILTRPAITALLKKLGAKED